MQIRNFEALEEARLQLLRLRPNVRQHWLSLAVAYHISGSREDALNLLEAFENILKVCTSSSEFYKLTLSQDVPHHNSEHSQIIVYHVQVLEESRQFDKALSLLLKAEEENRILDISHSLELKARLETKLKMREDADNHWRELIDINPDNIEYYRLFLENQEVDLGEAFNCLS